MEYEITVVDDRGRSTPVVVEAGPAATVKALRRAFGDVLDGADGAVYLGGAMHRGGQRPLDTALQDTALPDTALPDTVLPDDALLHQTALRHGVTVSLGRPLPTPKDTGGEPEVA
ncbi:MAG: hypothetical protein ACRDTU_22805, partial [Micromonosporaceae bacterium]